MKIAVIFFIACVVLMVRSQDIPTRKCPSGEHSVLYCPPKAEPTCAKRYIHDPSTPKPCDIPECFCDQGTLRDTRTNKCVRPEKC